MEILLAPFLFTVVILQGGPVQIAWLQQRRQLMLQTFAPRGWTQHGPGCLWGHKYCGNQCQLMSQLVKPFFET
nr:RcOsp10 [Ceratobasidium cereale]